MTIEDEARESLRRITACHEALAAATKDAERGIRFRASIYVAALCFLGVASGLTVLADAAGLLVLEGLSRMTVMGFLIATLGLARLEGRWPR